MRPSKYEYEVFRGAIGAIALNAAILMTIFLLFFLLSIFLRFIGLVAPGDSPKRLLELLLLSAYGFGFTQLIGVIPYIFWLRHKQRFGAMHGAIVTMLVLLLANGSCFLMILLP